MLLDEELLCGILSSAKKSKRKRLQNLLAQKGLLRCMRFTARWREYLAGAAASSLFEAKLAAEFFPGENHIYAPAYREEGIRRDSLVLQHISFSTPTRSSKIFCGDPACEKRVEYGIRINPEVSTCQKPDVRSCAAPAPASAFGGRISTGASRWTGSTSIRSASRAVRRPQEDAREGRRKLRRLPRGVNGSTSAADSF